MRLALAALGTTLVAHGLFLVEHWSHILFISPVVLLPAVPACRARSWRTFLLGVPKVLLGIYVPLWVFLFSAAAAPDWKGEAKLGWLSCFCVGKLVLLPWVLWATASFYALEVCQVANRLRPWIVLGYFQGAVVAGVCLLSGLEWFLKRYDSVVWWLAVPAYVAVYFTLRTIQLVRESNTSPWTLLKAWLAGIPLWGGAFYYSWKTFSQLPEEPPKGCFVVTAAARGHAQLVGPFVPHARHGRVRSVNHQLLTFWAFEQRWQATAPRTHRAFRRFYNTVGPRLARRLTNPWLADAAYLALKPCEHLAARLLCAPMRVNSPTPPLISTRLEPGVADRTRWASRFNGFPLGRKPLKRFPPRAVPVTGLKPGANERSPSHGHGHFLHHS